ncbi:MAG TPA: alpha/beta hydrolase [Rhizobacter sp.]
MPLHARVRNTLQRALAALASAAALLPAPASSTGLPPTLEHDASIPRVTLKGYPFHSEQFGDPAKPVLIIVHGGPGADYRYLLGLAQLADEYRVVFYDQRGTGLSPRVPASSITLESFVEDLDAFVDAFGHGRPVHVLGHSWGAMLASAYTGTHPRKVARLILAEPAFLVAADSDLLSSRSLPPVRVMWGFARAWLGKWFVSTQGDPYARDDWFLMQVFPLTQGEAELCGGRLPPLQAWRFGSPNFQATIGRMMGDRAFALQLDFRRGIERFEGPTLFLAGGCNTVHGEAHQRKLMGHFKRAELEVIAAAGHFMFNDQPGTSVAAVRRFLDRPASP